MPGPYCTTSDVVTAFCDAIGQDAASLDAAVAARFGRLAHRALRIGYFDLLSAIANHPGYTAAHLDRADMRVEWGIQQALFRMGALAAGFADYNAKNFESLDLRASLADPGLTLTEDGVPIPIEPGDSPVGGIGYGLSTAGDDITEQQQYTHGSRFGRLNEGY